MLRPALCSRYDGNDGHGPPITAQSTLYRPTDYSAVYYRGADGIQGATLH